jgi:hypothetical protein
MLGQITFKTLALLLVLGMSTFIGGCGGGSGGSSGASGPTIIVGASATLPITITNSSLPFSTATTVLATFKKSDGTPASGIPVTFSTTLGTLTPANGVATTDVNGTATVVLTAGVTSGQGQITATATVDNKVVNTSVLFNVTLPPLHLANLTLTNNAAGAIDFGSSQGVSVDVLDANGQPFTTQSVDVAFTSTQAASGAATISSPVPTVNGKASTTYTALTATGSDVITASIAGSSVTIPLTVRPLNAGSLTFISATPTTIGLKGMGGAGIQETSKVTFKVLDTSGAVKANQPVTFALNTTLGGLSLSATSGSTAADGTVSTIVQSGNIATPVRVTASTVVAGNTLSTQSDQLVVSTGIPAQDGFSISRVNMNPEAFDFDGVTTTVTARLSDHFHNPVPDGTAVSFTTSGGSIEPSCVTTKGTCSVIWTSQNPRPAATVAIVGGIPTITHNAGRAVVLAYAIGEEAFIDLNGNGLADPGEFTDTSEAFRDDNENRVRDANETFIDFNGNGIFDPPDGQYNGVLQGAAFIGAPKSKNIFFNSVIVMSTSNALITINNGGAIGGPGNFDVVVTDLNGNTMPAGTTIVTSVPFGVLTGQSNFTVPQNTSNQGVTLSFNISASATPKVQSGTILVTVKTPNNIITTQLLSISGAF